MKLPALIDDHNHHLIILLATTCTLLIMILMIFPMFSRKSGLPTEITPISNDTPSVQFNIVSPVANSQVSGTVPIVTTITNGPEINGAWLFVDGKIAQSVISQNTQKLIIYWDTTQYDDGPHVIHVNISQNIKYNSSISSSFIVNNGSSRNVTSR